MAKKKKSKGGKSIKKKVSQVAGIKLKGPCIAYIRKNKKGAIIACKGAPGYPK